MANAVAWIGASLLAWYRAWKEFFTFVLPIPLALGRMLTGRRLRFRLIVEQLYVTGVQSVPIMIFSLLFISMMLIVEFSFHMKQVIRQDSLVPAFSTLLMLRELGPIVTCLLLASRAGAAISAELATMKVTEQVDALRLLKVDPIEYLVVPRVIACVGSAVCLTVVSLAAALLSGVWLAAPRIHYLPGEFTNTMFAFLRTHDLASAVIKSAAFGVLIPVIASYHGLNARAGAQGVGGAATASVVGSSLAIIVCDFLLTYLFYAM